MKPRAFLTPLMLALTLALPGAFPAMATDTILLRGKIYTGNAKAPWAQAIAITGGRIEAVGTDVEITKRRTSQTNVIDLAGRMVIPGVTDTHTHMWLGALALNGFNFSTPDYNLTPESNPDAYVDFIKMYAAARPNDKALWGRGRFTMKAHRSILDKAVPDRPVIQYGTSQHLMLVNSKALALAGITEKPLANPADEKLIVRDAQGQPTGIVREGAMRLIEQAMPQPAREEKLTLLRNASRFLNQFGITSVANATGGMEEIELYGTLRDRGELTVRTRTAFGQVSVNHQLTPAFLADLEKARKLYNDDWVSANLVKFFADDAGAFAYQPRDYQNLITELDKRGFYIVTHAISPEPVHAVLNAYEELQKTNGVKDRRLRMEHLFNIPPDDMARFKKLSVVVGMQPSFCCGPTDPQDETQQWGSVKRSGAALAFSSDWPCTFPPDPLVGIQEAVTRGRYVEGHIGVVPLTTYAGPRAPEQPTYGAANQKLTVKEALDAYMLGAYANFMEDKLGTLEAGKYADLAVLSQNLLEVRAEQIGDTRVDLTMVNGKVVYTRP